MSSRRTALLAPTLALALLACGSEEPAPAPPPAEPTPAPEPEPAEAAELPYGLALSLAQFKTVAGKPVPGAARLEFLYRSGGEWRTTALEDEESNVFQYDENAKTGSITVRVPATGFNSAMEAMNTCVARSK